MGGYEATSLKLSNTARAVASLLRRSLHASAAPNPTVFPRLAIGAGFALVHR